MISAKIIEFLNKFYGHVFKARGLIFYMVNKAPHSFCNSKVSVKEGLRAKQVFTSVVSTSAEAPFFLQGFKPAKTLLLCGLPISQV